MEKQISHTKKELHNIKNRKEKSTIETEFDKNDNKISMLKNSNELDEEKVTKDNNISFSKYPIALFPSGILKTVDKHKI